MKTSAIDLTFPVIAFSKDGTILVAKDIQRLITCSEAAFKGGYHAGMRILSMDGRKFIVKSAAKTGTIKRWWSPPLFLTSILVNLEIEEAGPITLDELKQALLRAFKAD